MRKRFKNYWSLIKSLQTGLLLITGLAGFMSARCPVGNYSILLSVSGSLFLTISGSTVLNMWYDRDIDALMQRTCWRPLPSGKISPNEALMIGLGMSILGIGWSFSLSPVYALVVAAGLFFDVVVYTIWLKRRTAWSIVWGGISGGMPVLAGRVLGVNGFDSVGFILALAVLFWIPTHIMTFNIRRAEDYRAAEIPTFVSTYGVDATRKTIAASSVLASIAMLSGAILIGLQDGLIHVIAGASGLLLLTAFVSMVKPSDKLHFGLFKYASLYMIGAMMLIFLQGV